MAKKTYKMSKIEMFDTFVPIIAVCWVLVFAYISLFVSSSTLAMITVMPVFFLYAIYLVAGAYYCYKEVDVLKAFGKDTYEAEELLKNANITDKAFSEDMPPAPLHWMLSDKKRTIVAEQTKHGLFIYENPMGVLTNNPTFNVQMERLSGYMQSSSDEPENRFSKNYEIIPDSRGMGGIGLPGDWSSGSRFIKACFIRENSVLQGGEEDNVNHFFHILYSVFHQRGCVRVNGKYEITRYSSCCNLNKGIYYYTTYDDSTIKGVDMMKENLDGCRLLEYNLQSDGIKMQN